ncbi:MAG: sigma-54-dependent Fis family transcriptional regulator [Deltaproteobacteria bacterium]|nr:sigma-54-dependent Fis family transcriptional regulator [Deltaproteobacteria bacterium]
MSNILIVDDDKMLCKTLSRYIEKIGHDVTHALTLEDGLREVSSNDFDVVFLDVRLPDGDGLDALSKMERTSSGPEVIIITGAGDPDGAELAIRSGAWAYIEKPLSMENVALQLTRALQYRKEKAQAGLPVALRTEGIIGSSTELKTCLDLLAQCANSEASVLITGETGSGKEVFARSIHENSARRGGNFVVVDCAALPETLVGSILFGHDKGAFTGAERARTGLVQDADGGTLFLDEVGELPLMIQKDFLRVLQEGRFRPLGSNKERESNFRLISATNRDLEVMLESGQFRQDLFFRIQSVRIEVPSLRSRPQDIKDLAVYYMGKLCEREGIETKGFSPEFFDTLNAYDWPGNIRELIHTMERVLTVARFEPTLFPRYLPQKVRIHVARASIRKKEDGKDNSVIDKDPALSLPTLQKVREEALSRVERQYLHDLIILTRRDIREACRISGLSRSRLYDLLKKYKVNSD